MVTTARAARVTRFARMRDIGTNRSVLTSQALRRIPPVATTHIAGDSAAKANPVTPINRRK